MSVVTLLLFYCGVIICNGTVEIAGDLPPLITLTCYGPFSCISAKAAPQLLGASKAQALLQNGAIGVLPQHVQASSAVQSESGGGDLFTLHHFTLEYFSNDSLFQNYCMHF